jgi:hypothetical protein
MGSAVTAKRMCCIDFESCCFGCGFFETLLSVVNLVSSSCAGLVALGSSVFVAIVDYAGYMNMVGSNIRLWRGNISLSIARKLIPESHGSRGGSLT